MITHVTVLEDRAQIRRTHSAQMKKGFNRIAIDTTALVHDRSLLARSSHGRVLEVRCTRKWRIGVVEQDDQTQALAREEQRLTEERQRWERTQATLQLARAALNQVLSLGVAGVARELPYATALPDALTKTLPEAMHRQRQLEDELAQAQRALNECYAKQAAISAQRAALANPNYGLFAQLEVDVEAEEDADATLTIDYLVPCAMWRPMHRARLNAATVDFETEAAVWQATGEAWNDVTLSFSTARSTQRAEPPVLSDDWISVRDRQNKDVVAHVRAQRIQTTGEGSASEPEMGGVDDGGESRLLGAARKATVPSTGRMHRIPVLKWSGETSHTRTARPELSPLVHLLSRQKNASAQPILPGPVELVRDSGVVGTTQVLFVAAGETFVLNWGGDDAFRIARTSDETRDRARISGKQTIDRSVTLYLSNLADVAAEFQVEERIPVSELAQVEVRINEQETKPMKTPDDNGIIRWQMQLPPHATDTISLHYSIIAGSDVRGL